MNVCGKLRIKKLDRGEEIKLNLVPNTKNLKKLLKSLDLWKNSVAWSGPRLVRVATVEKGRRRETIGIEIEIKIDEL